MSTIRRGVREYLALRRGLGFKLHQEGIWLEQFASFLEERRSSASRRNWLWSGPRCRTRLSPRT